MSQTVDLRMLDALEIFHYSYRFQNRLFVLALAESIDLRDIITDLRVLHAAHIQTIVICYDHDKLLNLLQAWNNRGCPFCYQSGRSTTAPGETDLKTIRQALAAGSIPVIGLASSEGKGLDDDHLDQFSINLASLLTVDKVFFLSSETGLIINNRFLSHTTPDELEDFLGDNCRVNIGRRRLQYLVEHARSQGFDIVLLEGKSGCLFQEIFTHRGIGTLMTSAYPNIIRRAELSDVMDISLLMKPYVRAGTILAVPEDELAADISSYFVYTVNNSIVAAAKLTVHGDAAEMAKFCTLPRYQGKGRAHELARLLIDTACKMKKRFLFALSVEPRMFDFFRNLGFSECSRQDLPQSWLENYNLARPSKAFRLMLDACEQGKD